MEERHEVGMMGIVSNGFYSDARFAVIPHFQRGGIGCSNATDEDLLIALRPKLSRLHAG